jgi:hypothetical protein
MSDPVNHPRHYNVHPSGLEAIEICEHLSFCVGNAVKYVWRAGEKGDRIEDLRKAEWYLTRQRSQRWGHEELQSTWLQDRLQRLWQPYPEHDFLGKFLWYLVTRSLEEARTLVREEIKKAS